MDNQLLGGLIGLGIGIAGYATIGHLIGQVEARAGNQRDPGAERIMTVLRAVRTMDLILLPAICYFAFGFIEGRIIE
ncbi:MAG TPA: hypothetical protein VK862_19575 [Afifellaceae bacterium]|nr:hypothetical protein [Afifellaceae bacterium]